MSASSKRNLVFIALAISAFIFVYLMEGIYRPWIYQSGVFDFGIADSSVSFGGTIVGVFLFAVFLNSRSKIMQHALGIGAGGLFYEILQPYLGTGVFDIKDIFAVILGAGFSFFLLRYLWNLYPCADT